MSAAEWIKQRREHLNAAATANRHHVSLPFDQREVDHMALALEAVEAALIELGPHYRAQVDREAKFGRVGSACVCEACRAVAAIEAALEGR